MFGLGKFFKRGGLEAELRENPNQPEKWLKLAEENEKKAPEAIKNALVYSNGELIDGAAKLVKNLALYREIEPYMEEIEEKLGKEYSSFFKGMIEEYRGNYQKARNLYDVARNSNNKMLSFLANYHIANLYQKEGLYELAYKALKEVEGEVPESYKFDLLTRKRELEEKLGLSGLKVLKSFKEGLKKTRDALGLSAFKGRSVDESLFEELEERLILADVGVKTTMELIDYLRQEAKKRKIKTSDKLLELLKERLKEILRNCRGELNLSEKPSVILVLGVNGVGKTTTIGKLAKQLKDKGLSVVVAAADTFRAAAIEQLEVWAERAGARIVKAQEGTDPAAVVFDAIQSIKAKGEDVLIVDTAGRLHNKERLMKEIHKIKKVIGREFPGQPAEILLVLDANTGQNALSQAEVFKKITDITGIVLTKLDGTAKGGIVVSICNTLRIPIKYVGIGEKIEDLRPFDPEEFVEALFEEEEQEEAGG
ncbi:signal recognition particle-docking protein FtsY [Thermovibrio ammonificans HB-1]|uniref:Signal recognition particle receptor FtsY n=1 Tax=Thermovibrio ammonificans (strain DSM 15698 / JCM 12110 / HB-1) TaxID=648996 RepID=E8T1V6_THEA1|nr:signal recognition particle-docking protein FtsY [Thermovibrio ammonificans]ADU96851.1 signal recognition particle-docking protein FtsY [Thermovibrio ammonificans HB-1]